jgi:hypothetical protein
VWGCVDGTSAWNLPDTPGSLAWYATGRAWDLVDREGAWDLVDREGAWDEVRT